MIMTYDFALIAHRDSELMKAINDAMVSQNDQEVCTDIHRLSFVSSEKVVIVKPLSENSPFHYKVVPKVITYTAVIKMLNNNWADICDGEIMDVE